MAFAQDAYTCIPADFLLHRFEFDNIYKKMKLSRKYKIETLLLWSEEGVYYGTHEKVNSS